jgi:GTP-binding protein EngB required for normal cell division
MVRIWSSRAVPTMRDVVELLDALDLVVARGDGVVEADRLADASEIVHRIRDRRGFHGETLVLGLIGGTGSGKSSLLNAVAGAPLVSVSALRPHTDRPVAWLPANAAPSLMDLLDRAGIIDRHVHDRIADVALLDLPDIDSVAVEHRQSVESLLPEMDGVLWLVDPDKYRDAALHRAFLAPLARYRDQFAFVLNKIDVIPEDQRAAIVADLRDALQRDGYADPVILTTAADPAHGQPLGIDEVLRYLDDRLDAKRMLRSKVIGDARTILRYLADAAEVWSGWSVGFEEAWRRDRRASAAGLLPNAGPGATEDALCRLEDLIAKVASDVGDVGAHELRRRLDQQSLEAAVAAASRAAGEAMPAAGRRRRPVEPDAAIAAAEAVLEDEIGAVIRRRLRARAEYGATIASVGVGLIGLESR